MFTRRYHGSILFFLAVVCTTILRADSYSYRIVDYTQNQTFVGITTAGTFVEDKSNSAAQTGICGPYQAKSNCYATYYAGNTTPVFSLTIPKLSFDNGLSCAPAITDFSVYRGACNNGHVIFGGEYYNGTMDRRGIFTGTDPVENFLEDGTFDGGYINSLGDAVFVDGMNDTLVYAEDLSTVRTPEPTPLWSLTIGGLLVVMLFARSSRGRTLSF